MENKDKYLEKHLKIVSQINHRMESVQTKIEEVDRWRNMEKNFPSGLPTIKTYDIKLHTLPTNECQELASKFEEKAKQSLVEMIGVYDKLVQDVQKYIQWPKINFLDEHSIPFSFFQNLEDIYELVKVEVQSKEFISKKEIQEFLVKPSKEFSLCSAFIHKFMVNMEIYKECNLTLDIKKENIFNFQRAKKPLTTRSMEQAFSKKKRIIVQLLYITFVNIIFS